ncbi:MAG: M28 family peptidase, partial [Acetobacteraceae bacterium]|nr:M28 family peptidase [Acetobacteraceae bacterium]
MTPEEITEAVAAQRTLVQRLLDEVARIGADPPGITRDAFGHGENAAQALVAETAAAIGLATRTDAACNLHMAWTGTDAAAPRIALGSHLDSVVHGGNFDGAAGVIGALAAVSALRSLGLRPRAGVQLLALRCE